MNTVFIALGSNKNHPIYHVRKGMIQINHLNGTRVIKKSSLYSTDPLGYSYQPKYINAVIKVQTTKEPEELLDHLQIIESKHHRKRQKKWGPRTLDLDILIFNSRKISTNRLTIPHPEMIFRSFVLIPLYEITNYRFNIPKYGRLLKYLKKI